MQEEQREDFGGSKYVRTVWPRRDGRWWEIAARTSLKNERGPPKVGHSGSAIILSSFAILKGARFGPRALGFAFFGFQDATRLDKSWVGLYCGRDYRLRLGKGCSWHYGENAVQNGVTNRQIRRYISR